MWCSSGGILCGVLLEVFCAVFFWRYFVWCSSGGILCGVLLEVFQLACILLGTLFTDVVDSLIL